MSSYHDEIDTGVVEIDKIHEARRRANEILEEGKGKNPVISRPRLVWVDMMPLL